MTKNPKVMHGTACFAGTRVPASSLFDHLENGYSIEEFLEQFPSVRREQVLDVLANSRLAVEAGAHALLEE